MKLLELARKTEFKIVGQPTVYVLERIDGAYSICMDLQGNVHHFSAWIEVETI